jgi:hypothetical protein
MAGGTGEADRADADLAVSTTVGGASSAGGGCVDSAEIAASAPPVVAAAGCSSSCVAVLLLSFFGLNNLLKNDGICRRSNTNCLDLSILAMLLFYATTTMRSELQGT